jgi:hypothetical protein
MMPNQLVGNCMVMSQEHKETNNIDINDEKKYYVTICYNELYVDANYEMKLRLLNKICNANK